MNTACVLMTPKFTKENIIDEYRIGYVDNVYELEYLDEDEKIKILRKYFNESEVFLELEDLLENINVNPVIISANREF